MKHILAAISITVVAAGVTTALATAAAAATTSYKWGNSVGSSAAVQGCVVTSHHDNQTWQTVVGRFDNHGWVRSAVSLQLSVGEQQFGHRQATLANQVHGQPFSLGSVVKGTGTLVATEQDLDGSAPRLSRTFAPTQLPECTSTDPTLFFYHPQVSPSVQTCSTLTQVGGGVSFHIADRANNHKGEDTYRFQLYVTGPDATTLLDATLAPGQAQNGSQYLIATGDRVFGYLTNTRTSMTTGGELDTAAMATC